MAIDLGGEFEHAGILRVHRLNWHLHTPEPSLYPLSIILQSALNSLAYCSL